MKRSMNGVTKKNKITKLRISAKTRRKPQCFDTKQVGNSIVYEYGDFVIEICNL